MSQRGLLACLVTTVVYVIAGAACTTPRPAPAPPAERTQPSQAEPTGSADSASLLRLRPGEWWYKIWDGARLVGYAHISVEDEDGSFLVTQHARRIQEDSVTTVILDGWFNYDKDMQLVGYIYHGPGQDDWVTGRTMSSASETGIGPASSKSALDDRSQRVIAISVRHTQGADAGSPREPIGFADPYAIPSTLLGFVARSLPHEPGYSVPARIFNPANGKMIPDGTFFVSQRVVAPNEDEDLDGWLVHFVAGGYATTTFLIDEEGRMLSVLNGAGITLTERWLITPTVEETLTDRLPRNLILADEDRNFLPASPDERRR